MATLFSVLQPIGDFIHTEIDETLWLKLDIVYIIRYLSEICHLNQGDLNFKEAMLLFKALKMVNP